MPPRAADPLSHPRSGARPLIGAREPADIPPRRRRPPVPDDVDEDPPVGEDGEDQADEDGEDGEDQAGDDDGGGRSGGRIRPGSALAGAVVGLFVWPVVMAWISGGQDGAKQWLRAKFFNEVPSDPAAAKTTAAT